MTTIASAALDWCHRCLADTPTILAPLRCGHIGRLCSLCRSLRHPRPWASKAEYLRSTPSPEPSRAKGVSHGHRDQ